jgi:uncharacterized protein (TIGR03437 family)
MRFHPLFYATLSVAITSSFAVAQITLNPSPTRAIGQDSINVTGVTPNLVEGREFDSPLGIALDTTVNPPHVYVADTGNNRVLGWANAASFTNGQVADIVMGQPDLVTTYQAGPTLGQPPRQTGLNTPVGLAVDAGGNLYVADCGNNRILRFPQPFAQPSAIYPNLVLGQNDFTTSTVNLNGIGPATLYLNSGTPFTTYLTFDGSGNLWVADPGNNRVLRFPAGVLSSGTSGGSADVVIGQPNFTSRLLTGYTDTSLNLIATPTGVGFDSSGNLFVSESANQFGRILVFPSPQSTGESASQIAGVPSSQPATSVSATLIGPFSGALAVISNQPVLVDSYYNRVLFFPPVSQWTAGSTGTAAVSVIGQANLTTGTANMGQPQASATSLQSPSAIAYSGTELYIADSGNNRMIVMPQTGSTFGPATRVLGQDGMTFSAVNLIEGKEVDFTSAVNGNFVENAGMVIDINSNPPHLYIADPYNNRVLGFNDVRAVQPGSTADIVIGQPDFQHNEINYPSNSASMPNQSGLYVPVDVTVDVNGNLYVADSGNARIMRFPAPFATPANLPNADIVLGQSSFTIKITDPSAATMASPYGLAFTGDNGLLASDNVHNRVLFFGGSESDFKTGMAASGVFGQPDFTTISTGSALNQLNAPHHIAADTSGNLYVADTLNSRISIFTGVTTAGAGAQAAITLPQLNEPFGVSVNPSTGEIWVANTGSGTTLRFPDFNNLTLQNYQSNFSITQAASPLAITQDAFGALYVADASNRIAVFYPGVAGVNAANYLGPCVPNATCNTQTERALSPGTIVSLFSTSGQSNYFGSATQSESGLPLPLTLAGTQVLVNNVAAPLFYVGPTQINFFLSNSAPTSGTVTVTVQSASTGQVLGSSELPVAAAAPGLFTLDSSGSGQVAAINQNGTVNGPSNPAPWNSVVSFYGTGAGMIPNAPPDGMATTGPLSTSVVPQVIIGAQYVPAGNVQYSGLAPYLVGVWQVNVLIPSSVAPTTSSAPTPVILLLNGTPSGGPVFGRATTMWVTSTQ